MTFVEWYAAQKQRRADSKVAKNDPYRATCPNCGEEYFINQYIGTRVPTELTIICRKCLKDFDVSPHDTHGYKVPSCSKR